MAELRKRTNSPFWYTCRVKHLMNLFSNCSLEVKRAFFKILAARATSAECLFNCCMCHTNNSVVVILACRFSTKKVASTRSNGKSGSVACKSWYGENPVTWLTVTRSVNTASCTLSGQSVIFDLQDLIMDSRKMKCLLKLDYVICHMVSRLTNLVMSWSQG